MSAGYARVVRMTLNLDDDLAMVLQDRARMTGRPFKEVVNACLRKGLAAESEPPREPLAAEASLDDRP